MTPTRLYLHRLSCPTCRPRRGACIRFRSGDRVPVGGMCARSLKLWRAWEASLR